MPTTAACHLPRCWQLANSTWKKPPPYPAGRVSWKANTRLKPRPTASAVLCCAATTPCTPSAFRTLWSCRCPACCVPKAMSGWPANPHGCCRTLALATRPRTNPWAVGGHKPLKTAGLLWAVPNAQRLMHGGKSPTATVSMKSFSSVTTWTRP